MKKKHILLVVVAVFAAFLAFEYFHRPPPPPPSPGLFPPPRSVPHVFRSQGGLLEVGGFGFTEDFSKSDPKVSWGIDWGTTVSNIQVVATYRYHIELQKEWTVNVEGQICRVNAPELQPTLPVAFNSSTMIKKTANGWGRFNKDENLSALEQSITPELNVRAKSPEHIAIIREAARTTVAEFIQAWLLREDVEGWKNDGKHVVKVLFPGEKESSLVIPKFKWQKQ